MRYSTATVLAVASAAGLASAYPSADDIYARDIDVTDLYARDIYDDIYARDVYDDIYARDVYEDLYARDAYAQEDPTGGAAAPGGADPAGATGPAGAAGPPGPPGAGEPLPAQGPETAAAKQPGHHKKHKKHKHKNRKHKNHKHKHKHHKNKRDAALYDMDLETRDVYDADLSARDLHEREALLGLGRLWRKIRGKKSSAGGDSGAGGEGEGAPQRRDLSERDAEAELEELYERDLLELDRRWRWGGSKGLKTSYSKTFGPSGSSSIVKTSGLGNVDITASSTVVNGDGVQARDLYERDAEADYEFEELYARDPEADWEAVDGY